VSHDRGFKRINNGIACYVHRPHGVSSVRNGRKCCYWTFKYEPTFKKKNPDKETKFKSRNTSKINAYMLQNFALSTSRVTKNSKMVIRRRHRSRLERY